MGRFDKFFLGILIGLIPPILFSLLGWWISIPFVSENKIYIFLIIGLSIGIILDFIFLKRWIKNGYDLSLFSWLIIYFFYSICIFGFFMGVPVFNVLVGILAGIYTGRKILFKNLSIDKGIEEVKRVSRFSTVIIFLFSVASAYLALTDPFTAVNLRGMFNLSFDVTKTMIYGLIIIGGSLLLIVQYWVTKLTSLFILKRGKYFV